DTLLALQQIAASYRRTLPLKAVVITGSNGKTSTKDFTAAVLSRRFKVIKTEGNLNNHIGLPLTLLRASAADEIGVFEIGMNHPGEIGPLAQIAQPEVGVITNIGVAHIEFMGSRDAIAAEKGMLAEALGSGGHLVLDTEDDYTPAIAGRTRAKVIRSGAEVCVTEVRQDADGSTFTVHENDRSAQVQLPVPGRHMISNALLAIAVGTIFGLTLEECAAGLAKSRLTKGRLELKTIRGIRVIDDSYNANPDSMVAALQTLSGMPAQGRRIAVLGKMNELGVESERGHRRVGEAAGREGIDCLVAVGTVAAWIADAAVESGVKEVIRVATTGEAADVLRKMAQPGDVMLVKGSRSVKMETIVEGLAV
ncbi:MAG: UDP-N-acetylmuramoyl-tripeptide--D-alanyl-D-alanine ligase, partial [Verrucomicrobiota bacterium]